MVIICYVVTKRILVFWFTMVWTGICPHHRETSEASLELKSEHLVRK